MATANTEEFEVLFEEDRDVGGYHVWCPALPGCHPGGDTPEHC